MERSGPDSDGDVYLTLLNDSADTQETVIHIQRRSLGVTDMSEIEDLLNEEHIAVHQSDGALEITTRLDAEQARVLRLPGNL